MFGYLMSRLELITQASPFDAIPDPSLTLVQLGGFGRMISVFFVALTLALRGLPRLVALAYLSQLLRRGIVTVGRMHDSCKTFVAHDGVLCIWQ